MTNGDRFLREGVSVEELTDEFEMWHYFNNDVKGYGEALYRFMQEKENPAFKLTEDERVILRNIDKDLKTISRYDNGLYLHFAKQGKMYFYAYNHLFQFIKERRRIFY